MTSGSWEYAQSQIQQKSFLHRNLNLFLDKNKQTKHDWFRDHRTVLSEVCLEHDDIYCTQRKSSPFLFLNESFIEIKSTYHIVHLFQIWNSLFFWGGRWWDGPKSSFGFLVFSFSLQFNWLYMLQGNLHVDKPQIISSKDIFPVLQTHIDSSPFIIFPSYLLIFQISN